MALTGFQNENSRLDLKRSSQPRLVAGLAGLRGVRGQAIWREKGIFGRIKPREHCASISVERGRFRLNSLAAE